MFLSSSSKTINHGVNLGDANIFNADFRGAKLYRINLRNVKNLRYAKFDKIVFEEIRAVL